MVGVEPGCLEGNRALSETAGAQEEKRRPGEQSWVMRNWGLHEGWMSGVIRKARSSRERRSEGKCFFGK